MHFPQCFYTSYFQKKEHQIKKNNIFPFYTSLYNKKNFLYRVHFFSDYIILT